MNRAVAFIFTYRGALVPLVFLPPLLLPDEVLFREPGEGPTCVLAGLVAACGLFFRILGVRRIGGRARIHSGGARELFTTGIFCRVRNPLYVGNILYAAGISALWISLSAGGLVLLGLLGLYTLVVRYEEGVLLEQFGEPFARYLRTVPRWFPRLHPPGGAGKGKDGPPVSWTVVLRHERVFLAGGVLSSLGAVLFRLRVGGLETVLDSVPYGFRAGAAAAAVLLVSALLVRRVGARLRRKRGSWLAVDRVSGEERSPS